MARPKKRLSDGDKRYLLSLKPDDITRDLFCNLFCDKLDPSTIGSDKPKIIPPRFNTYDEFELAPNEYFNKEKVLTNCGLFIFNKFLIEPEFVEELGYINYEITKKSLGKIDGIIINAIMVDETDLVIKKYINYLNRLCWLAFTLNTQICSSLNIKTSKPLPSVTKLKKQLLKDNAESIKNNDAITYSKIQTALVNQAKKELEDDPAYELYASGARGAFDNAYRQWLCTKGPVWNAHRGEFEIVTNSLHEGFPKESIPAVANSMVSNFYAKAIGPGECGYLTKQLVAAFQSVVLDERGSDCGTKLCADVHLTKDNLRYYIYGYIKEGNKYVRLDNSNKEKYLDKDIKIRVADYCCGSKLCNMCAGDGYYLLGLDNVGITFGRVSNSTLRAKMKKSHDSTVRVTTLDPNGILV